jgi:hypothetical protein
MSNPRSSLATGDLAVDLSLVIHRPQGRREWITWYATQHAIRDGLIRRGADQELVEACGLDADTIADTVARWGGPAQPDPLFWAWFGVPTRRPAAAPVLDTASDVDDGPTTPPAAATRPCGDVDEVLIERAMTGDQAAVHLLTTDDRVTVAGRMFTAGRSMTAICKLLHVSGTEASKMVGAYRRRGTGAGGCAA